MRNLLYFKNFILLLLFNCLTLGVAISQTGNCNMDEAGIPLTGISEDYSTMSNQIRIYWVLVRRTNGSGPIQESIIPDLMDELEETFLPHGISFQEQCRIFLDNDFYFNNGCNVAVDYKKTIFDQYHSDDGITIFVQNNSCGTVTGQASDHGGNRLWMKYDASEFKTLSHEIGHCLGLYHTNYKASGMDCKSDTSICFEKGDFVCDTPPEIEGVNYEENCIWNSTLCHNDISCKDTCGDDLEPDIDNIMFFANRTCRNSFTPGQGNRFKKYIMEHKGGYFDLAVAPVEITRDTIFSVPTATMDNMIIKAGINVTVTSTLAVARASKIILEPGAVLNVFGGKLTLGNVKKLCSPKSGNNLFWNGIELQTSLNGASSKVFIYNGIVEFMEEGIHLDPFARNGNYIINIDSSTFKNNKHSIKMVNRLGGSSYPIQISASRFFLEKLNTPSIYTYPLSTYFSQIIADNATINIKKCTFDNPTNLVPTDSTNYAIKVMNCNITVSGDSIVKTVIKDGLFGIWVGGLFSNKFSAITNCLMDKVKVGVRINGGVNNYIIKDNEFKRVSQVGLWSNNSSGYTIRKNFFNNSQLSNSSYIGALVEESGTAANLIDNNRFITSPGLPSRAIGINGLLESGLQYRCNSSNTLSTADYKYEGVISNIQGDPNSAAGNFTTNTATNLIFDLNGLGHNVTYYHRNITEETPGPNPKITDIEENTLSCTFNKTDTTKTRAERRKIIDSLLTDKKNQLISNIDDGNTILLMDLIHNTTSTTANSNYQDLLDLSPWLSVEVILAAHARADVFSESQRFDLILNNPDNYGVNGFASDLAGHSYSLSPTMLTQLQEASNTSTVRTVLLAEISELGQEYAQLCYEAIAEYKHPDTYNVSLLNQWLVYAGDYRSRREIVDYLIDIENYSQAFTELNTLSTLSNADQNDISFCEDLVDLVSAATNGSRYMGSLSISEQAVIEQIAIAGSSQSSSEARAVLEFYYHVAPPQSITTNNQSKMEGLSKVFISEPFNLNDVRLYPNPVQDQLIIELPTIYSGQIIVNIDIWDNYGKLILTSQLSENLNNIDVSNINSGLYHAVISDTGGKMTIRKVLIIR